MTSIFKQAATHSLSQVYRVPTVQNIEARIRAQVWKKQIRIKAFFQDYDKLRKGHCIEDKFISGLASALSFLNIHLNTEQIKALADRYRVQPGDLIKYNQFVNVIDQQFGNTELAKTNLNVLRQNGGVGDQAGKLQQLHQYIKWAITSKRIFIKPPLQDYDRTNSNLVTKQQFIRVLDNLGLVKNEQLADLLCRKYARSSNPKQICYKDFIRDVQDVNAVESLAVKGIVNNPSEVDPHKNIALDLHKDSLTEQFYVHKKLPDRAKPVQDVLKRVQAEVTLKRLRIRQFFLDYDGLRKNIVTGLQFRRILNSLNLSFTDKEYKEIVKAYGHDEIGSREERIKWMDFCDDVDKVFTIKELQKDPILRVGQIDKGVFEPVRHSALEFTQQQLNQLEQLLKALQKVITTKRLHLKPLFQDFDITKIGYVTKNQFARILKQFDLVPPTQTHYNLLLKKYMDRGNLVDVNYYEFIRDADKYGEVGLNLSKTHTETFKDFSYKPRQTNVSIRHQVPDDLTDLLSRLRREVKEKRIRVSEFMRDFDKLRHGNITKDQFRLALNMAKLPVSQSEFQQILAGFTCENKANYIKWKQFCDNLDEVFGVKQLEKKAPNQPINAPSTTISYGRTGITAEELALANKIKQSFKQYQLINRLDTKQMFENWDKLSRFKVSPKQFRQVLATVGFNLSEEQNRAVCKLYASDDEDESQVCYLQFLKDTKPFDFSYMTVIKQEVKRGTGQRKPIPNNIEDILFELRKTTKLNRLRYRQYFQDFDPLRKGNIKRNKFRSVIFQTMKVNIDERLFSKIEQYYGDKEDNTTVNYSRFCDDLDIVFNLPDREKEPTLRHTQFNHTVSNTFKQDQTIDSLMRRLGEVTRKHRILLKPFFQDKDIAKIGRVSFTRMRSILDNNKIPLTDNQFNILCKAFAYENIEFNYVEFIEALKKYQGYEE